MKAIGCIVRYLEAALDSMFALIVAFLLIVMLVTAGCDCGCKRTGTLKLIGPDGSATRVCRGTYHKAGRPRFECRDGRVIYSPTNFIIE